MGSQTTVAWAATLLLFVGGGAPSSPTRLPTRMLGAPASSASWCAVGALAKYVYIPLIGTAFKTNCRF